MTRLSNDGASRSLHTDEEAGSFLQKRVPHELSCAEREALRVSQEPVSEFRWSLEG